MQRFFNHPTYYDAVVQVGETKFNIHKIVLVSKSPVFETAFFNGWLKDEPYVFSDDDDPLAVEWMLRGIYGFPPRELPMLNRDQTVNALDLVYRFDLKDLQDILYEKIDETYTELLPKLCCFWEQQPRNVKLREKMLLLCETMYYIDEDKWTHKSFADKFETLPWKLYKDLAWFLSFQRKVTCLNEPSTCYTMRMLFRYEQKQETEVKVEIKEMFRKISDGHVSTPLMCLILKNENMKRLWEEFTDSTVNKKLYE